MRRGIRLLSRLSTVELGNGVAPSCLGPSVGASTQGATTSSALSFLQHASSGMQIPRFFSSLPAHTVLTMPALSPTMTAGNIASWHKKEGDPIKTGDMLADIETDKATLAFEMVEEGFVAKILLPAGSKDVTINTPIAVIVEEKADIAAFKDYKVAAAPTAALPPAAAAATQPAAAAPKAAPAPAPLSDPSKLKIGPGTRFLMEQARAPLSMLLPTGPRGFVTREDALDAVARFQKNGAPTIAAAAPVNPVPIPPAAVSPPTVTPARAPAASLAGPASLPAAEPGAFVDIPNNQIRRVIAKRLLESKTTIPHLFLSGDVRLEALGELRAALKEQGRAVSVNDLIIRAAALALRDVPQANGKWDDANGQIVPSSGIDISIAVATPTGLITPIVKGADQKSVFQISAEVKDLAKRARDNKLKPEEFMGGSFSISNLGMFGMGEFSAIINPPQAAILAVGGPLQRVVMEKGQLASETYMNLTVSADQRVVDGETAGRFLGALKKYLEVPGLMLAP